VLRLGGRSGCLLQKKIHKKEGEMGKRRVNRQVINKKLIEGLTNIIIPLVTLSVILSVKISCHHMIYFF